jgi:DNA-binding MarR family transcriptional regulator
MQPTYRTWRVLRAIRERPGSTNRQVAGAAGIEDEGQASKLLKRLEERFGLIKNTGAGARKAHCAHAWRLTAKGREVLRELQRYEWD